MGIETSLLLLESVLSIVPVTLLLFSLREGRRRNLLLEVEKAIKYLHAKDTPLLSQIPCERLA